MELQDAISTHDHAAASSQASTTTSRTSQSAASAAVAKRTSGQSASSAGPSGGGMLEFHEDYFAVDRVTSFERRQIEQMKLELAGPSGLTQPLLTDEQLYSKRVLFADTLGTSVDEVSLPTPRGEDYVAGYPHLHDDVRVDAGIACKDGEVRFLDGTASLKVQADHFKAPKASDQDDLRRPSFMPVPDMQVRLKGLNIVLRLHSGYDWGNRSMYLNHPDNEDDETEGWTPVDANTFKEIRSQRDHVEIVVEGLSLAQETFRSADPKYSSRVKVVVRQLEILDKIVSSPMNKFLTDFRSKEEPREYGSNMFSMEMVNMKVQGRPETDTETAIRLGILPIKLHLDQDTLNFLISFFTFRSPLERKEDAEKTEAESAQAAADLAEAASTEDTATQNTPVAPEQGNGEPSTLDATQVDPEAPAEGSSSTAPYFKICVVDSFFVKVDYLPKGANVTGLLRGHLEGILGVVYLEDATAHFRPVTVKAVSGWDALIGAISTSWIRDLTGGQIPDLLFSVIPGTGVVRRIAKAGIGIVKEPVESFPNLVQGARDGIYNGVATTAAEAFNVGAALTFALQSALEFAQGVVSGNADDIDSTRVTRQPTNVRDGFLEARRAIVRSMNAAYTDVAQRPSQRSSTGLGTVMRTIGAIPSASLRPLIGICEALSWTFQGVRNGIDPELRKRFEEKYKS